MTLRYTLFNQLHFLGEHEGQRVLITMQRWDSPRAARRRSDHVIVHNGVIVYSKRCLSAADLKMMDGAFTDTEKRYGNAKLTEEQARNLIGELTGTRPEDKYCSRRYCPAAVPLGAARCEEGHPYGTTGTGSGHAMPAGREILLPTGGPR
jgi:hypothetical protein